MDTCQEMVAVRPKQRRQLRTNGEKRRIVEEALAEGASVAAVARRHGLNANLLFKWRNLYRQGLLGQCREPARLLPVRVTPTAIAAPPPTSGCIEIDLPGEVCVRVRGRVDAGALVDVFTALARR